MKLSEENFLLYAMHHYEKASVVSIDEFEEDLKRFTYVKKLLNRHYTNDDLKERLILNHIIILYNVFGNHATNMLLFKVEKNQWPGLMTFLLYLNRLPEYIKEFNIKSSDYILDETIINKLREL